HEMVRPGLLPPDRKIEGPGPGEQRTRGLVAEDAPPGREVADRRVAEDQLPVVVDEVARDGRGVDAERDRRRQERKEPGWAARGRARRGLHRARGSALAPPRLAHARAPSTSA